MILLARTRTKCDAFKSAEAFGKARNRFGRAAACKACKAADMRRRWVEQPEHMRSVKAQHRERNHARLLEQAREHDKKRDRREHTRRTNAARMAADPIGFQGYVNAHQRIRRRVGSAREFGTCFACGKRPAQHWGLSPNALTDPRLSRYIKAAPQGSYSDELFYRPVCARCNAAERG